MDVVLFPLDTIKTRLQSKAGFLAAGAFRNIYAGIVPAAAGSAPSGKLIGLSLHFLQATGEEREELSSVSLKSAAATFFCTYELVKSMLGESSLPAPLVHMAAASLGEVVGLPNQPRPIHYLFIAPHSDVLCSSSAF